jgi:hypothetical protein
MSMIWKYGKMNSEGVLYMLLNNLGAKRMSIQELLWRYLTELCSLPSHQPCQLILSPEVYSPGNGNKPIICKRLNIDHNFIFISYKNLYVSAS